MSGISEEMDRIEQRCRDQLAVLRGTGGALERVAVTVSGPDDVLRVRLDGACRLTGLHLSAAALRLGDRLGPLIVDTVAVAAREVGRQRARIMTEFIRDFHAGPTDPLGLDPLGPDAAGPGEAAAPDPGRAQRPAGGPPGRA